MVWKIRKEEHSLLPHFYSYLSSKTFVNVEFICMEDQRCFGHKFYLNRFIKLFSRFPDGPVQIFLPDYSVRTVENLLELCYTGAVYLKNNKDCADLTNLMDGFGMETSIHLGMLDIDVQGSKIEKLERDQEVATQIRADEKREYADKGKKEVCEEDEQKELGNIETNYDQVEREMSILHGETKSDTSNESFDLKITSGTEELEERIAKLKKELAGVVEEKEDSVPADDDLPDITNEDVQDLLSSSDEDEEVPEVKGVPVVGESMDSNRFLKRRMSSKSDEYGQYKRQYKPL